MRTRILETSQSCDFKRESLEISRSPPLFFSQISGQELVNMIWRWPRLCAWSYRQSNLNVLSAKTLKVNHIVENSFRCKVTYRYVSSPPLELETWTFLSSEERPERVIKVLTLVPELKTIYAFAYTVTNEYRYYCSFGIHCKYSSVQSIKWSSYNQASSQQSEIPISYFCLR